VLARSDEPKHLGAGVTYGHQIPLVTVEYPAILDD
jgi:hypothetical protein